MTDASKLPIEFELLEDVVALDLEILDTKIDNVDDEIVHVRITLQDEPDILASCSWGPVPLVATEPEVHARGRGGMVRARIVQAPLAQLTWYHRYHQEMLIADREAGHRGAAHQRGLA
jgi:hypothetical protein